ncbi:MAG: ABC transporter ATP-binding protein [Candidatus Ornithospirochaeta sp.]
MINDKKILLDVKDLKMYFPVYKGLLEKKIADVKAVDGITFSIEEGTTFGLVGESGCGKTTVGKCILRINHPTDGRIIYDGTDITDLKDKDLKALRRQIQLVFQDPYGSLDPRQSVGSIIKEALSCGEETLKKDDLDFEIRRLLSLVELDPAMADRFPHEMSGGQRQRLGIARALACNPRLIVCDEPVSALDVSIQAQIINLFMQLQKKLGLTYLFIAHDLAVVRHIADRIGVMYLGHIVEMIDADELYRNPIHPYTKALLSAVPITDYYEERSRKREILQGEVPSPMDVPQGCPFNPRCPIATEKCRKEKPQFVDRGGNHLVACHNV